MGFEVKLVSFCFSFADAWGEYPPCNPPNAVAGRKGGEGTGMRGLARGGTRWPSGARPTQPSQTVQVAGVDAASCKCSSDRGTPRGKGLGR